MSTNGGQKQSLPVLLKHSKRAARDHVNKSALQEGGHTFRRKRTETNAPNKKIQQLNRNDARCLSKAPKKQSEPQTQKKRLFANRIMATVARTTKTLHSSQKMIASAHPPKFRLNCQDNTNCECLSPTSLVQEDNDRS